VELHVDQYITAYDALIMFNIAVSIVVFSCMLASHIGMPKLLVTHTHN